MQVQSMSVQGSQLMASTLQGTFARVFELHRDKLAFGVRVCMLSRVVGAVGHTPLRRCRVRHLQIRPELPDGGFGADFQWQTYGQIEARVTHFKRGLASIIAPHVARCEAAGCVHVWVRAFRAASLTRVLHTPFVMLSVMDV